MKEERGEGPGALFPDPKKWRERLNALLRKVKDENFAWDLGAGG